MRKSTPFLALLPPTIWAASSSGCNSSTTPPSLNTRHNATLSNSSNRTYMYYLPPTYNHSFPTPIILSFHGAGQSSSQQADLDLLTSPFFNTGQIVIYPQASQPSGQNKVFWQMPTVDVDDVTFVMDILDEFEADFCIDTERIYATGKSQGGGFVGTLACNATSAARIAAFAPVSGAFYMESDDNCASPSTLNITCNPGRCKIPIIEFHGGADPIIDIDGGERRGLCLPSIEHYMKEWAKRDGFSTTPAVRYNITAEAEVFKSDDDGMVMFVYDGDDIRHDWPCTVPTPDTVRDMGVVASFNATSIITDWFGNFSLPSSDDCLY